MKLLRAELTVYDPAADGMETEFGLSRDWRFGRLGKGQDRAYPRGWRGSMGDFIVPLDAWVPWGDKRPRDMRLSDLGANSWYVAGGNQAWREVKVSGHPHKYWLQFYDGRVHTSESEALGRVFTNSWADSLYPNLILNLRRYTPPAGQSITPRTSLTVPAERAISNELVPGYVSLMLPLAVENQQECLLHWISVDDRTALGGDPFDVFTHGDILDTGPSSTAIGQGVQAEQFVFEYDEDRARLRGGHIYIRQGKDFFPFSDFWSYQAEDLWLTPGLWEIGAAGCVQFVNVTPLRYGDEDCYTYPSQALPLPVAPGSAWAADVEYSSVTTEVDGWDIVVGEEVDDVGVYRPYIVADRTDSNAWNCRPIVWFASETHAATVEVPSGVSTVGDSTQGDGLLDSVEVTLRGDWRGATGSATFKPEAAETYSGWKENGKVEVELGWESGAGTQVETQKVATHYIRPGGLQRVRSGENATAAYFTVSFADFAITRMLNKAIHDFRQAGGQTVRAWITSVCNRLGLPASMVSVDTALADTVIQLADPPSAESFAPKDGDTWNSHLDAVCNALGMRWGFDKDADGALFVDDGPPAYTDGVSTISFDVDIDTATEDQLTLRIASESSVEQWRNFVKGIIGDDNPMIHYIVDTLADRTIFGDTWSSVARSDADSQLGDSAADEFGKWQNLLTWKGVLRPGLRPDQFIKVSDGPWTGITANSVFQIVQHRMKLDARTKANESEILAVRVYEP